MSLQPSSNVLTYCVPLCFAQTQAPVKYWPEVLTEIKVSFLLDNWLYGTDVIIFSKQNEIFLSDEFNKIQKGFKMTDKFKYN